MRTVHNRRSNPAGGQSLPGGAECPHLLLSISVQISEERESGVLQKDLILLEHAASALLPLMECVSSAQRLDFYFSQPMLSHTFGL